MAEQCGKSGIAPRHLKLAYQRDGRGGGGGGGGVQSFS